MFAVLAGTLSSFGAGEQTVRYHTPPKTTHPIMAAQADYDLPSLLVRKDGSRIRTPQEWEARRQELLAEWTHILGKLEPSADDRRWFGDVTKARISEQVTREGYTRTVLTLPMETDFDQSYILLTPSGQGPGPFPAVIAWTSTTPDFTKPEEWWGAWLARRGYVVLCGWSFIRNYREASQYRRNVNEVVYQRFGRWAPLAKMVHDVRREAEFLRSRPEVDAARIGFMGFSLSAKTALYVAAFAPEIAASVAIDPHVALHGATNYGEPWYLDWGRPFADIRTPEYPVAEYRNTVWSLLDADPGRPGFEHNHHEIMALAAPRPLLVIGCSTDLESAASSDDRQSIGYVNRAREVYQLLGVPGRLEYAPLTGGHRATGPDLDPHWQAFLEKWLRQDKRGR
jgi:dienelactone hydrolase